MSDPDLPAAPADVVHAVPVRTVAYGMQLLVQSPSTLDVAERETRTGPREMAEVARAAEPAGFFYLGVCDHTAIPRRLAPTMGTVWYDTTATLGWLAAVTTRTSLLSHVLVLTQRHPLWAAKELATIDRLSGGRVIVGVGAGHVQAEYDLLTGDFAQRGRHTDEAVSALATALSEEYPDLPGPRWPARVVGIAPRPVQSPRPPIWIGGSSPAAIRRTAADGDGWLPQGTRRADLPGQIALLRRLRYELRGGAPLDIGTIAEPIHITGIAPGGRHGGTAGFDASWDLPRYVLKGPLGKVAESLRSLVAMGVNHPQVCFMARSVGEFCGQTAAFGAEVAPLLGT